MADNRIKSDREYDERTGLPVADKKYMVQYHEAESWTGPGYKYRFFDTEEEAREFSEAIRSGSVYYKVPAKIYLLIDSHEGK